MGYEKVSSSTMELLKNNKKNNYEVIMKKNRDGNGRPVAKRIENEPKRVYDGIVVLTQIPNEFYRVRIDGMVEVIENRELKENEYRVDYTSGKVYFNQVKEGKDVIINLYYGDGIELIPSSRIYMGVDRYGEPMGTLHEILVEATDSIDALNKVGGVIKEGERVTSTLNSTIGNANNTNDKVNKTIGTANATINTLNSTIKNSENHNNTLNDTIKNSEVHNNTLNSTIKNSENKNNTLNSTINVSNEKNSLLTNTINNANATNDKVNKTIGNATTHDNTLNNTISNANKTDDKLKATINNANTVDGRVKTSIDNANGINSTLNSTIKNADSKNSTLNSTISTSTEKDRVLNNTINSANSTNDKVNKTILNSEAHNNTLNGTISSANNTNDKVNNTINNANSVDSKVKATIDNANGVNSTLNSTIKNADSKNNILNDTIKNSESKNSVLNGTINTSVEKNSLLTNTIASANSTNDKVNSTINNANSHDNALNVTITNANKTDEKLKATINNANSVDTKVKNTTETANNTNNTLNSTIKNAEGKNSTLNGTITNSVEKDKTLNSTIGTANTTNDKVNGTIRIANETNSTLGASIKQFNDSNNTLKATINTANSTNDKVNETIKTANGTNDKVNSTIGKAENINNTLGATIGKAETDNKTLSTTISTAETKNTVLTKTVSDSNTSKTNLEATINNAKSTDGTLKGTIGNANNSNTTLNNTIKDSVGKNSSLANTISQVKNNNDTLIATIDRANSTNNTLNGSNNTAKATKTELDKSINEAKTVIGNTNDLLTGVQTNKKDIADLKERVVKTNNYIEIDTKGNREFRIENSLEGKTEGLKIFGDTLHNLIKGGKGTFVIDKNKNQDMRIYTFKLNHNLVRGKKYVGYIQVNSMENVTSGLRIYGWSSKTGVNGGYFTCANNVGVVKFKWDTSIFPENVGEIDNLYLYVEGNEFNNGAKLTFSNFMLFEEGTDLTCVNQYFEGIKSVGETEDGKVNIVSHSKNLFNINNFTERLNDNGQLEFKQEGNTRINSHFCVYTENNPNSTIVLYGNATEKVHFTTLNQEKYYLQIGLNGDKKDDKIWREIFLPKNMSCFYSANITLENNNTVKFKDIQIEVGNSKTQYESYKEDKKDIIISPPLKSIRNIKDVAYINNGRVRVCRKINQYTFTGNENMVLSGTQPQSGKYLRVWIRGIKDLKEYMNTNIICNNIPSEILGNVPEKEGICISNGIDIQILKSKLTTSDLEGFKQWLKANPTTIIYQVNNPTTEILENCVDINLNSYKDVTYINSENSIVPQITCKLPKNLATTIQETTNRVDDLEKIMYGIEGLKNFEGRGEYLEYDNTNTGFINNCVIEGNTLENLFDINNSFVYASVDNVYLDLPMCENKFIQEKVYSVNYENATSINCIGTIIAYDSKKNYIGEKWFNPNTWDTYTVPKNTSYIVFRGLRKVDGVKDSVVGNGFRFTVLEGDWTNKNAPKYFYGYGSVGEKSKNLFNGEIESGSIDTGSKRQIEDPNKFRSDFITVMPNTYYTLSFKDIKGSTSLIVAEYDYNKNIIKTSTVVNKQSFLSDIRTVYIKVTGENERVDNIQIEEGKKATVFENNYEGYKIKLNSFSKNNLWNKSMVNLINFNTSIDYGYLRDLNTIRLTTMSVGGYVRINFALENLKPKTNYTIAFDCLNKIGYPSVIIRELEKKYGYDNSKSIYNASVNCDENKRYELAFTTGEEVGKNKIVTIGFYATTDKQTKTDCCFSNIVLAETKEYKNGFIVHDFDEKSLFIKEPLRNLNDFSDKIEKIEGVYKVNRIIEEKRLDGSENWRNWKNTNNYCCFHLNLVNAEGDWANQKYLKCNKMKNDVNSAYGVEQESCALDERGLLYICIEKAKLKTPDVNGFKAWLQNNVVNILYKLRVPSIEDLIDSDRPNLKVYNDSTIISTLNNTIVPTISFEIPRNLSEIVKNNTDTIKENSESAKTISSAIAKNSINIMVNKNTEKVLTSKIVQTSINLNRTNTTLNGFVSQKNQEITTINKKIVELEGGLLVASTTAPKNLNALWLDITA